ncbi:MAG: efflux RND transporter permease subunit, partial [Deltaproteobacteria bacterium]
IVMVMHLQSSILISGLLPLAVLICFIAMKLFHVDANIMALSGIAIAIGTMVDMGVILCENILKHLDERKPGEPTLEVIFRAASEVGSAVVTAISTTVVSFLPVFAMTAAEGKLFKPLAYTKTFALIASVIVALTIIPPLAHIFFVRERRSGWMARLPALFLIALGVFLFRFSALGAGIVIGYGIYRFVEPWLPPAATRGIRIGTNFFFVLLVTIFLTDHWMPLGIPSGFVRNFVFVAVTIGGLLGFFLLFQKLYGPILRWCLDNKMLFLSMPLLIVLFGATIWLGFDRVFSPLPALMTKVGLDGEGLRSRSFWATMSKRFPGLGKEFMPPLDEGSYLYMPTTMPHASIGEALDVLKKQDMAIRSIPEVESVVGKIGRAETPLDPAPISMVETIVNYKPEYITDEAGHRIRFRFDEATKTFARDAAGNLIPDPDGEPFRQWRPEIRKADDIWKEIVEVAQMPGSTSAPRLQPIAARIVMLQSGMRAPMGVKVKGPDLPTIERVGLEIERFLKEVPSVEPSAVIADRIVGKPYLEVAIDREAIARYGLRIRDVQNVIEIAIGGRKITTTVEGRERYPVRVRYQRELRDTIESLGRILVPAPDGSQIPLEQLAEIRYVRGPQVIKSEDTFLVGYVLFDMKPGYAEVDVVEDAKRYLEEKIESGEFDLPAGV